jgi:hypothetical protein
MKKPQLYKDFIDRMVDECQNGQGAIGPSRVRDGVWNKNATPDFIEDQFRINQLLVELNEDQRETIASMLEHAFVGGVFETLKALEEFEIDPFLDGYEGSPYHDFIGRVAPDPWQWPNGDVV